MSLDDIEIRQRPMSFANSSPYLNDNDISPVGSTPISMERIQVKTKTKDEEDYFNDQQSYFSIPNQNDRYFQHSETQYKPFTEIDNCMLPTEVRSTDDDLFKNEDVIKQLFMIFTAWACAIVACNLLQILFLEHDGSKAMINGAAGALCGLTALVLIVWAATRGRGPRAVLLWNHAHRSRRVAWAGAIISIVLPLFVCQFIYLNTITIPEWHKPAWKTGLVYNNTMTPPLIVLMNVKGAMTFTGPGTCSTYDWENISYADCGPNMQWNLTDPSNYQGEGNYHQFNPQELRLGPLSTITITYPFTWNSSVAPYGAQIITNFLDSTTVSNPNETMLDFYQACGLLTQLQIVPALSQTYVYLAVTEINDEMNILSTSMFDQSKQVGCNLNIIDQDVVKYNLYTSQVTSLPILSSQADLCDVSIHGANATDCYASFVTQFTTNMITTQTSDHGTSRLDTLIDEGGIIGGLVYATWFFSLYII